VGKGLNGVFRCSRGPFFVRAGPGARGGWGGGQNRGGWGLFWGVHLALRSAYNPVIFPQNSKNFSRRGFKTRLFTFLLLGGGPFFGVFTTQTDGPPLEKRGKRIEGRRNFWFTGAGFCPTIRGLYNRVYPGGGRLAGSTKKNPGGCKPGAPFRQPRNFFP